MSRDRKGADLKVPAIRSLPVAAHAGGGWGLVVEVCHEQATDPIDFAADVNDDGEPYVPDATTHAALTLAASAWL